MPIVFEEVTGEILPERTPPPDESPDEVPAGSEAFAETVRRELQLTRERERRLRAD